MKIFLKIISVKKSINDLRSDGICQNFIIKKI